MLFYLSGHNPFIMTKPKLVVGASGATGRLVVKHLLEAGHGVRVVVRSTASLPGYFSGEEDLEVVVRSLLDMSDSELRDLVEGCDAVVSCLGHNLSFKGVYGQPRRLVRDAAQRLCKAINLSGSRSKVRYILMNTTGNSNRDINEPISLGQRLVTALLRLLLPPHVDNEQAADFLRTKIGQTHDKIEWVAVRPDTLIDDDEVSEYQIHPSPTRSPMLNPGKTSRINAAHFMFRLATDDALWEEWKGQMPVVYNKE